MALTSVEALWFLPFVLPVCLYITWTDLSRMKIPNKANIALFGIFVIIGPLALPTEAYLWRFAHAAIVLAIGFTANMAGVMGGGDAKFLAAAAPFIAYDDLGIVLVLLSVAMLAAVAAHRLARHTPLKTLAPDWKSWDKNRRFPMGFPFGWSLCLYLALGVLYGAS
ncbi:prepilin peptidase [Aestuariibius insulae]|uniref:A24 family peptidase n=1 Tax=Aestuariibius insulae TaxID=2058287 RepID=UPI00345E677C